MSFENSPMLCEMKWAMLYIWQSIGEKHLNSKLLKGFKGSGVLEIVDNFDGNIYRAVYTVKLAEIVYVLHAFQKKSKKGITTPPKDIELIKKRLKLAIETHKENQ